MRPRDKYFQKYYLEILKLCCRQLAFYIKDIPLLDDTSLRVLFIFCFILSLYTHLHIIIMQIHISKFRLSTTNFSLN